MINCPVKSSEQWKELVQTHGIETAYKLYNLPNLQVKQTSYGYKIGDTLLVNTKELDINSPVLNLIPILVDVVDIKSHFEYPVNEYKSTLIGDDTLSFMQYVLENDTPEINYLLNTEDLNIPIKNWLETNKIEDIGKLNPSKKLITDVNKIVQILLKNNILVEDELLDYYENLYDIFKPQTYEELSLILDDFLSNEEAVTIKLDSHTIEKLNDGLVLIDNSITTTEDIDEIISVITDTYNKTKSEWLLEIINKSDNDLHIELAKLFYEKLKYFNDTVVDYHIENSSYMLKYDKIEMKSPNQRIYLHEFIHNLTTHLFLRLDNLNDEEQQFINNMLEYYYLANGVTITDEDIKNFSKEYTYKKYKVSSELHYGLTNIEEFIAESLTNPVFQQYLATIPYKNKSILHKVYNLIIKFLGRLIDKKDNLLSTVVSEIMNYIENIEYITKATYKADITETVKYLNNNSNKVSIKNNYLTINNLPLLKLPANLQTTDVQEILNDLAKNYNVNIYTMYNKIQHYVNDISLSRDILNFMYEQKILDFDNNVFISYIQQLNQREQATIYNRLNSENRYSAKAKLTSKIRELSSLYNKLTFKEQTERRNYELIKKIVIDNNIVITINDNNNTLTANQDKYKFKFTKIGIELSGKEKNIEQIAETLFSRYNTDIYYNNILVIGKPETILDSKVRERENLLINEEDLTIISQCK